MYISSVRTSQETYFVSVVRISRLMQLRIIIAVYCENHIKYKNVIRGQNAEFQYHKSGDAYRTTESLGLSLTTLRKLSTFTQVRSSIQ
jgi:hypothetical protein